MVTDDIKIAQEIFYLLDDGIVNGYDSFEYTVHIFDGYMQEVLLVTSNGIQSSDVATTFNGAILYSLVEKLKQSFLSRGEDWKSFSMSYVKGSKVNTKFEY